MSQEDNRVRGPGSMPQQLLKSLLSTSPHNSIPPCTLPSCKPTSSCSPSRMSPIALSVKDLVTSTLLKSTVWSHLCPGFPSYHDLSVSIQHHHSMLVSPFRSEGRWGPRLERDGWCVGWSYHRRQGAGSSFGLPRYRFPVSYLHSLLMTL